MFEDSKALVLICWDDLCTGSSHGKGQDMFLRAFVEGVYLVNQINIAQEKKVFTMHALLVGSDWAAPSYELMLRKFVKDTSLESKVHFVNKSMDIVSYLAASDVLVQNSQVSYMSTLLQGIGGITMPLET